MLFQSQEGENKRSNMLYRFQMIIYFFSQAWSYKANWEIKKGRFLKLPGQVIFSNWRSSKSIRGPVKNKR